MLLNLAILALGAVALSSEVEGVSEFRMFTIDGNIFVAFTSLLFLVFQAIGLFRGKPFLGYLSALLRLMATVTEAVIFLVVLLVLVPMTGTMLITGFGMVTLHLVNPLLCLVSFVFFERHEWKGRFGTYALGCFPLYAYASIAVVLVLAKVWTGNQIPYPFLDLYQNPVWESVLYFGAILGGALFLSWLLVWVNLAWTQWSRTNERQGR